MPPLIGSIGGISEYAYRGNLDDYPDEFLFSNITNAEPGVNYTSGITTITGINYKTKVSVGAGGSFSVNGDAFSTAPRFLRSGDELELSLTTVKDNLTTDFSRENNLVVFVGKRETIWSVTTRDINNNLVPFSFTTVTNHPVGSSINSNTVNISGLETGYSTPVSVIGFNASISINGGSLVTSGNVSNGDNFYVNLPALSTTEQESYGRTRTTSVTVGTYTTTWTVITESPDLIPDAFSFTNVTNAQINTTYTSNSITVSGINGVTIPKFSIPISISGSGFEYNINGGAFTSQPGLVVSGDVIALRTTPISYATTSTGTLTINGVSSSWSVTTGSQPFDTVPDPFSFSSLTNTPQNTTFTSNEITLSGMTAGFSATATISGTGQFRVVRNGTVIRDYSSSSTNVQLGDKITLRNTSSSSYSTTKTTTFIVSGTNLIGEPGTTSASWNITTEAPPIPPTITLNASSTSVIQGNSVTLTWSSSNATSVTSSNFGASTVNGSTTVTPSVTTTYNITVSGPGGSVSASITVNVSASAPTITLNASPITITQGSSATLTWSSSNATSVTSSNFGASTVNGSTTVSPSTTTTYNITVSGPGGSTTATVTVTVLLPPTITLNASQTTIAQGESTTLTWSSTDATSVTSSNFGATTVNGSTTVSPSTTTTYTITVSGPGGSATATRTITVLPPPTITLSASSTTITQGSSVTLTWSSTNATGVSSSNFGATTVSGSTTVTPSSSTTYTITVSGPGGSTTATVTVTVLVPPTITLTASPSSITQGSSATLTWSSSNATSVTSSNFGASTVNGSTTVSPSSNITYNITVSGPGGSATASANISVSPPPTPTPTVSLSASPLSISKGSSSTLTWSSTNATSVSSSNFGASTVNGSTTVSPSSIGTIPYNITVSGPGGSADASVNISVYCIPIEGQYGSFGATGFTGYLLYGNGFKDSNLQLITNPGNSALSNTIVTTAGGITTTYGYIGEVVINHYVNNFARYPELPGGYDGWINDFITNPSYINFAIFTNTITATYNQPGGEKDIRASRGGLVGNYDSCDVKRL